MSGDTPAPGWVLRPAGAGDLELTYDITREAMRGYVERTWGPWDEDDQRRKHAETFDATTTQLVEVGGAIVGLVTLETHAEHVWLVKLYLRERVRGRGLGTQLLRHAIGIAEAAGLPLRLRVLRVNTRARALYERHGFRLTDETAERFFMERGGAGGASGGA